MPMAHHDPSMPRTAVIIGAGPAGLTTAYELQKRTKVHPIILEQTHDIGGISKTECYKGNRIDIGGHRFFSKDDRVMQWWQDQFPLQGKPARDDKLLGRTLSWSAKKDAPDPEVDDLVMLIRTRISRIFFLRRFFDYPVSLSLNTIKNLGVIRLVRSGLSYIWTQVFPRKDEKFLENFFINRFGKELYKTFFEDYTEKVWGVHPSKIRSDWGAQRVKGLSISAVLVHAIKAVFLGHKFGDLAQKKTETSLIEQFFYPKLGPGQMWETVATKIEKAGGELRKGQKLVGIEAHRSRITRVYILDTIGNQEYAIDNPDFVFSSMPVKDLIAAFRTPVPQVVKEVASGLVYRDFLTVGLLLKKLAIQNETKFKTINNLIPDNWIYIQERDVKVGRLQIFNNWSPYMVKDPNTVWVGMEYFCNEGDDLWSMTDDALKAFGIAELAKIDIINSQDVLDSVIVRMPKAYPAYFGTYDQFSLVRDFADLFENLFLIGRNGQHRYNNADHSMACAMEAVDNIVSGRLDKENIWSVNTEIDYHEVKKHVVDPKDSQRKSA